MQLKSADLPDSPNKFSYKLPPEVDHSMSIFLFKRWAYISPFPDILGASDDKPINIG